MSVIFVCFGRYIVWWTGEQIKFLQLLLTVFVCCIIRPHKKSGDNETLLLKTF